MKIYHNQLANKLQQGLSGVYLVFGDEPWQKQDALSQIKDCAQRQDFSELIRFYGDDKFDWAELTQEYQAMSLFASRRIIELELPTGKVNERGAKALISLTEAIEPDVLLIIHGSKLDGASQKRKWFKALEQHATFLPVYELEGKHLSQWLNQRAKQQQIRISNELSQFMLTLFSGNLLALAQELEKLALLYHSGNFFEPEQFDSQGAITLSQAEPLLINQARFNPFQLIDSLLAGNLQQCATMLEAMAQEGVAAGQIIWLLHKELDQLYQMKAAMVYQQQQANELFKQFRIWPKRQPLYQQALSKISIANIEQAISRIADTDLISKSASEFNPFLLLLDVCLSLYHSSLAEHYSLDYLSSNTLGTHYAGANF
ncbi:DNA polymerase III subunit delta [Endozoicomonas sp. G2_1]|uniref:DNA polymerase III subunit delta n=1 Tax=Endozoicomonas sp. G2_1 TaxID=2821091 RepID=UPI001ADA2146|nr:DNA polymerase III subunit delta [Endozoicomonas sp. G2_1]